MATPKYYDDGATGLDDGTSWSDAFQDIRTNNTDPGDECFVDSTHNESAAAVVTLTTNSDDSDDPITFLSVTNPGSDIPPTAYAQGASIAATGVNDLNFNYRDTAVIFIGFDFAAGDDINFEMDSWVRFVNGSLELSSTNGGDAINLISANVRVFCENTAFKFGSTAQGITVFGGGSALNLIDCWIDGAGSVPVTLFEIGGDMSPLLMVGCHFSASTNLFKDAGGNAGLGHWQAKGWRCKLPATIFSGGVGNLHTRVELYGCTDGTTLHDVYIEDALGITSEDLTIYRVATNNGSTGYSLKMVSTANTRPGIVPHRVHLCDVWAAANATFDVELITTHATAAATLDESEFWIEVIQPNSTGPLGTHSLTVDSDYGLGTPATLTAGDSGAGDWTGELADTNFYKCSVTVASGAAGVHSIWANLAPGSIKTVYVDPHVDVT